MGFWNTTVRGAVLAGAVILALPAFAQAPPPPPPGAPPPEAPRKKHHHGDVGAGIAAGVLGGLAGAAILGNQGAPPPPSYGYAPPPPPPPQYGYAPPPPPPGPRYGVEEEEEVSCRIVRRPVYDEDGSVVSYRTRRVCN